MQWSRSCGLLHLCVQLVERRFAPRTPAWTNVADQRFGFHDAHVWFFINRQEIIRTVTNGNAAPPPVIGKSHLMDAPACNHEWPHSRRDQNTRFDNGARTHDGRVSAMLDP